MLSVFFFFFLPQKATTKLLLSTLLLHPRATVHTASAGRYQGKVWTYSRSNTLKHQQLWLSVNLHRYFFQHLTLFLSSLFSSMSRLHFCCRSASSMRRASASAGSGPAAPRWSFMKLCRWLRSASALSVQSADSFNFNKARWVKLGIDTSYKAKWWFSLLLHFFKKTAPLSQEQAPCEWY